MATITSPDANAENTPAPDGVVEPTGADRRVHERISVVRPCKMQFGEGPTFVPATSVNVSAGGALVQTLNGRPVRAGETVRITLAEEREAVTPRASMIEARVVRVTPIDRFQQAVALAFRETQAGAAWLPDAADQRAPLARAA